MWKYSLWPKLPQWLRHNLQTTNTLRQRCTVYLMQALGKTPVNWTISMATEYLGEKHEVLCIQVTACICQQQGNGDMTVQSCDKYFTQTLTSSMLMAAKCLLCRHKCHWLPPSLLGLCSSDKLRLWPCMVSPNVHMRNPVSSTQGSVPISNINSIESLGLNTINNDEP